MPQKTYKLLISARNTGAVAALSRVFACAREDEVWNPRFVSQLPGTAMLASQGIEVISLPDAIATVNDAGTILHPRKANLLMQEVSAMVDDFAPDAILTGLSNMTERGVDEALIFVGRARGIPTFTFQDFWGSANNGFGLEGNSCRADAFFVLDEYAARLSEEMGLRAIITGSPKHHSYPAMNYAALRAAFRARLGARENERVQVFFGQNLVEVSRELEEDYVITHEDYRRAMLSFFTAAAPYGKLVYRPHPDEDPASSKELLHYARMQNFSIELDDARGFETYESCLAGCDAAFSWFSTSLYDYVQLKRLHARKPFIKPVFYLPLPCMRGFWHHISNLETPPLAASGAARYCTDESMLAHCLKNPPLLQPAQPALRNNEDPARVMLAHMRAAVEGSASAEARKEPMRASAFPSTTPQR